MTVPLAEAKNRVVAAIAGGASVASACQSVGRKPKTYDMWRLGDKAFAARVDEARRQAGSRKLEPDAPVADRPQLSFAEWRKQYLGYDTYPHQQQWVDAVEGRAPVPIQGCEWDSRYPRRIVVNVAPFHAKTATLTVDYSTYLICHNPNVRIVIVSKRQEMARKMLYQIKQRLVSKQFAALQEAYAPEGGFRPASGEGAFTQNLMYVAGRTGDEKDPTIEALGMGGQIYGVRADLIILDDCIVLSNANEYEKQIRWLESEVESRVMNGTIIVIGTRLAGQDMYSELRNDDRYLSGRSPWSYLRQPMVLEYADDPANWKTLWPTTTSPPDAGAEPNPDGTYTMWDGPSAARIRDSKPPSVWSLVYQQEQTAEDATFTPEMVGAATNRGRAPGPLTAGAMHHPGRGGEGMWTIASMDPAMAGDCFTLVGKVDRNTQHRWIENAWVQGSPSPQYIRDLIERVTIEYGVNEWVIEEQGFQGFLVHDPEINRFLQTRGVRITGTYTGRNKLDPDFGVASVASLFGTFRRINEGAGRKVHNGDNLIQLPDPERSQGIKALKEELCTWVPGVRGSRLRQDGPMALWFFEQRARVFLGVDSGRPQQQFMRVPFLSRGHEKQRVLAPVGLRSLRRVG